MTTTTHAPNAGPELATRDQSDRPIELPPICRHRKASAQHTQWTADAHRAAPPSTTHAHATQLLMYTCRHRGN